MVWAVMVAAGRGERMGLPGNKVFHEVAGKAALQRCLETFAFSGLFDGLVVVVSGQDMAAWHDMKKPGGVDIRTARGGETRQESVRQGLLAVPEEAGTILVHDAARPLVTPALLVRCIRSVAACGSGVAAVPLKDTVAACDEEERLETPLNRAMLRAMQTPQAFRADWLREAYARAEAEGWSATDDAALVKRCGHEVQLVPGEPGNFKLTTPEDLLLYEHMIKGGHGGASAAPLRIGQGYDVHRLVEGRPLILCGHSIPYEKGLLGHSDADVALHALMDALLGAAALGDIGRHFPDTEPAYKGASSMRLLEAVVDKLAAQGLYAANVDITIVAQRPKLKDDLPKMRENVAGALALPMGRVNVKATTTEGLGFEGLGEGISAHAVVMLSQA